MSPLISPCPSLSQQGAKKGDANHFCKLIRVPFPVIAFNLKKGGANHFYKSIRVPFFLGSYFVAFAFFVAHSRKAAYAMTARGTIVTTSIPWRKSFFQSALARDPVALARRC